MLVTTECSVPVSTMKSTSCSPTDVWTMVCWGLRRKETSRP
jgi:hypothetical protein